MIKLSTTFPDRTICQHCLKPADLSNIKYYASNSRSPKELLRENSYDPQHVVSPSIVDIYLKNRNSMGLKLGYISYNAIASSSKISYHRKFKTNGSPISRNDMPKVVYCPCGKTYWIDYSYSNSVTLENNRKSKV